MLFNEIVDFLLSYLLKNIGVYFWIILHLGSIISLIDHIDTLYLVGRDS